MTATQLSPRTLQRKIISRRLPLTPGSSCGSKLTAPSPRQGRAGVKA